MDWGIAVAAAVTGLFGIPITLMQREQMRRTKTNHGKLLGQHVEAIADDAREAKLAVTKVAADLAVYKLEQARESAEDRAAVAKYVADDAIAHASLRELVVTVGESIRQNTRERAAEIQASSEMTRSGLSSDE